MLSRSSWHYNLIRILSKIYEDNLFPNGCRKRTWTRRYKLKSLHRIVDQLPSLNAPTVCINLDWRFKLIFELINRKCINGRILNPSHLLDTQLSNLFELFEVQRPNSVPEMHHAIFGNHTYDFWAPWYARTERVFWVNRPSKVQSTEIWSSVPEYRELVSAAPARSGTRSLKTRSLYVIFPYIFKTSLMGHQNWFWPILPIRFRASPRPEGVTEMYDCLPIRSNPWFADRPMILRVQQESPCDHCLGFRV